MEAETIRASETYKVLMQRHKSGLEEMFDPGSLNPSRTVTLEWRRELDEQEQLIFDQVIADVAERYNYKLKSIEPGEICKFSFWCISSGTSWSNSDRMWVVDYF